ncbi:hypothetical protein JXJ21_03565 [candidate division KSB1 bacterium]|nr:hypothetical protein [candidate division KSB1 bacterium]
MHRNVATIKLFVFIIAIAVLLSCAAGSSKYSPDEPAGFWSGLWHGFICLFTFIIGLFADTVRIYEISNSGGWYDFGFVLGAMLFFSGSGGAGAKSKKAKSPEEKEWEEIGEKVEAKVRKAVSEWVDEHENEEWAEIGKKIEQKIKRELKNWADK